MIEITMHMAAHEHWRSAARANASQPHEHSRIKRESSLGETLHSPGLDALEVDKRRRAGK